MKNANKYFLIFVVLIITGLLYSGFIGKQQISQREKDYLVYNEIKKSIKLDENLETSLEKLEKLQEKYNDSYVFNIDKGFIYNSLNQKRKAQVEFEKAFKKNKTLLNNVDYLIVYAEILHLNGDDKAVKRVISQAKKIGIPKKYKHVVKKMVSEI